MKTIKSKEGKTISVSDKDFSKVEGFTWMVNENGYAYRVQRLGKKRTRIIMMHSSLLGKKEGFVVDHKDGNRLNNCTQKEGDQEPNLRYLTYAQNARNRVKSFGQYKYKGVKPAANGNFKACIEYERRQINIGIFDKEELAAAAYDIWAMKLDPAYKTNFKPGSKWHEKVREMLNPQGYYKTTERKHKKRVEIPKMERPPYKGIYQHRDKWGARIYADGVKHFLGRFNTPREAALAYNDAARRLLGADAKLNEV
jgi:hypothetical protein